MLPLEQGLRQHSCIPLPSSYVVLYTLLPEQGLKLSSNLLTQNVPYDLYTCRQYLYHPRMEYGQQLA